MRVRAGNGDADWRIAPGSVAVASIVVALASLAALAVVASVKSADTLATVALGLAVIAFVVQLIVFIVQSQVASQQDLRAQEVYGSMMGVLAELRERTQGTQTAITSINERLLEHVLGKAIGESGAPLGASSYAPEVARALSHLLTSNPGTGGGPVATVSSKPRPRGKPRKQSDAAGDWPTGRALGDPRPDVGDLGFGRHTADLEDVAIARSLVTLPDDRAELERALAVAAELSPEQRFGLMRLAEDEVRSRRPSSSFAPGLATVYSEELERRGLIEPSPYGTISGFYVLTPAGRAIARVLYADEAGPPELSEEIARLRREAEVDRRERE